MDDKVKCNFLRTRMKELRTKNHISISTLARKIGCDSSTLSRAEKLNGNTSYKTVEGYAKDYCRVLNFSEEQTERFLRCKKIVVVDTSALLKNNQLIDELSEEYYRVIIPNIVINELDNIKNRKSKTNSANAWRILQCITNNCDKKGENVITRIYSGKKQNLNNDQKIIEIAKATVQEFKSEVDIITYDTGFSARLSGIHGEISVLFLADYIIKKQKITDMQTLKKIDQYYANSYEDMDKKIGIQIPNVDEINAYLDNGYTLIISIVRNRKNFISSTL